MNYSISYCIRDRATGHYKTKPFYLPYSGDLEETMTYPSTEEGKAQVTKFCNRLNAIYGWRRFDIEEVA